MPAAKKASSKIEELPQLEGNFIEFVPEPQPESLIEDALFLEDEEVQDTTNHTLAGEGIVHPGIDVIGNDKRFSTPERVIKGSAEPAAVGGDSGVFFDAMIERLLQSKVDELIQKAGGKFLQQMGSQPFQMSVPQEPVPPSYVKHYRCDLHPDLQLLELDMTSLDRGERPQANPIPGSWIKFRRGHLYLGDSEEDANKIRQIEWMRGRPAYSSDGQQTLGGNQSIYEDDGGDIFRCTAGCDYITASRNAWKAHMQSTHGITVN